MMVKETMKNTLSQDEKDRIANITSRLNNRQIMDISFSSAPSGKQLEYMENVLDILDENQPWLDENARKKAAKYK